MQGIIADEGVEVQAAGFAEGIAVEPAPEFRGMEATSVGVEAGGGEVFLGGEAEAVQVGPASALREETAVGVVEVAGDEELA